MSTVKLLGAAFGLFAAILGEAGCRTGDVRETSVVRVVREFAPAVVNIRTEAVVDLKQFPDWGQYGEQLDRYFREHYGKEYQGGVLKYKSVGSGVVISNQGVIVTNAHVVQKAKSIVVVLKDGAALQARVVFVSAPDDLAVIRVKLPRPVKEVRFANLEDIMIGETVIAIGNPFGLENSVTVGVISGKDRTFSKKECGYSCSGLLQTDASINPGNSGGPLFNLDGELVGINLAVAQDAQSIGFAIPASKIADLLKRNR